MPTWIIKKLGQEKIILQTRKQGGLPHQYDIEPHEA